MAKRPASQFIYDGAISFAGENRDIAKSLAEKLKAKGLSIFFVEDHMATLWGKGQHKFERVYSKDSRYVIPIISEHYVRKDWTQHEFGTAVREQRERQSEFILAIRVDNSRILGLHDDKVYCSLKDYDLDQIADFFEARVKADKQGRTESTRNPSIKTGQRVAILTDEEKHALRIMVVSRLPLPLELYKSLFPDIDWTTQYRTLTKYNLVSMSGSLVEVSAEATKAIRSDERRSTACSEQWVKRLEEQKDHQDIAFYLALNYFSEGRVDDAVCLLAEIANGGLHGHWNETYLGLLEMLAVDRVMQRLKPETRIILFHALGVCSIEANRHEAAIAWFEKARKFCIKTDNKYWLGQCFINSGIALDLSGDLKGAATAYDNAIDHGQQNGYPTLVGRAYGNLAQLRMAQDEPDAAIALIRKSIEWKKRAKDKYGIAFTTAQLGLIEAKQGDLKMALEHFIQAETLFAQHGMVYDQAKSACNVGNSLFALGQNSKALKAYKRAQRLAADDDYLDLQLPILQGIAQSYDALKRHGEIERAFTALLNSPFAAQHNGVKLSAYHGIGLAQALQGRLDEGRVNLKRALTLARRLKDHPWMTRCLTALAGFTDNGAFQIPPPERFARFATQEEKRSNWIVASDLWDSSAKGYAQSDRVDEAENAFSAVSRCLKKADAGGEELVALQFYLFAWRWQMQRYEAALQALEEAERLATTHKLQLELAKVFDERGFCFQRLGRSKEALLLHKRAAEMARKHELPTQLRTSLNNFGETARRLGRVNDAVVAFEESEKLAREVGNFGEALATMVCRGLTIQEGGDSKAAGAIFRKSGSEARRRKCWRAYVMALEALGNLAWREGRLKQAEEHYREGLAIANKDNLKESAAEIAVKCASLLLKKFGKPKEALALLRVHEDHFAQMTDAHVFHEFLADLYFQNGDLEAAKRNWELGKAFARLVGNEEYVAICSASLAGLYERDEQFESAEGELETALAGEVDPELRAELLSDLLRVELALGNEKKAQSAYHEAEQLAEKHGLSETSVTIHLHVADHNWREDLEGKQSALEAYLFAVVTSLSTLGNEAIAGVMRHTVMILTDSRHAPSEAEWDSLLENLKRDTLSDLGSDNPVLHFALWPFETARRLLPFKNDEKRFRAELEKATNNGFLSGCELPD